MKRPKTKKERMDLRDERIAHALGITLEERLKQKEEKRAEMGGRWKDAPDLAN